MTLGVVDWIILAIVGFSTLVSIKRGFVKEALSLVTLIAAMIISRLFGAEASTLLVNWIETPAIRYATAYAGLFIVTLIIGGLINSAVVQVIRMAGLGGLDRTLGMVFGFARGVLILVVVTAVFARVGVSESLWWQESLLIPEFVAIGDWLQAFGLDGANRLIQQAGASSGTAS
ncbi:MAG: membrane protein required for colicin V production [Candidatus Azotimanducaceae bacterium]